MGILITLIFLAVFLTITAASLAFTAAKESPKASLKRRLRHMVREAGGEAIPDDLRSEIIREIPPLERLISRIRFLQRIDLLLDHAGLQTTLTNFVLFLSAGAAVGFAAIFGITRNFKLGLLAACSLIVISIRSEE